MATLRSPGPGRLPKLENLRRKTPEELLRTLSRFGIEPDVKALEKRATRAFERLEALVERGHEPDASAWARVDEDVAREVRGQLADMAKSAIRSYRLSKSTGLSERFTWISVGDENTCDSCESRHGKTKTMAQWERAGLPGDSVLQCCSGPRKPCRCVLEPEVGDEGDGEE